MSDDATVARPLKNHPASKRRLLIVVGIAGFGAPLVTYFWIIHHYAVNVVFLDQWSDVNLAGRSYAHTLTVGNLWTQHGEQRMFFPNLVMLLLVHFTHMNIVLEEYFSALMLCAAAALLIWTHKRRTPSRSWIADRPVAIVLLSLVQAGSTLFGFQLAWYAAILMLAATLFLLDRPSLSSSLRGAAIVTAVIGSFCTIEGLIIWPVGFILLYQRRRPKSWMIVWSAAAVVTVLIYEYRFETNQAVPSYLSGLHLPGAAARSYFQVIGDVLGVRLQDPNSGLSTAILVFGVLLFLIAIYALVTRGLRRDTSSGAPIGIALICFSLTYALGFAYTRAFFGPSTASSSQYTTFTLLLLVGCYLALLDRPARPSPTASRARRIAPLVSLVLIGVICLQVVLGEVNGIREARSLHQRQIEVAGAIVDIHNIPNPILQNAVGLRGIGIGIKPQLIRSYAAVLMTHHLTFFDNQDAVSVYTAEARAEEELGMFKYVPPALIRVPRPIDGQTLQGTAVLDALVRPGVQATEVDFHLIGEGGSGAAIGSGQRTTWGWILKWDTRSVTNGSYRLVSVVSGPRGPIGRSASIAIEIKND